ncbi:MAG: coiled-coil domain-containing protein [Solirubrobacterales bacterium]
MAVVARELWTDERLDDLNKQVDAGFTEMRTEFRALRGEMTGGFQAVRSEMKAEFQAVRSEMKAEFQAVRSEMKAEFQAVRSEMKAEFQTLRSEIQGVRDEVAAMNRNLIQLTWGLIGMMLVGFLGIIATILTRV